MAYEFEGVQYGKLRDMQEARRARYVQLLEEGLNFTQAAHAVGVMEIGCGQVMEGEVPLPEVYAAEIGAGVRSPACRFQPRVAHVGEGAVRVAPVLGFVESSHGGFLPFWRTSLSCK